MKSQFGSQIQQIPTLIKSLEPIANIPIQLDKLFNKIEQSNNSFSYEISQIMSKKTQPVEYVCNKEGVTSHSPRIFPSWINWTIVVSIIIIALACVTNTVYNVIPKDISKTEMIDNNVGEVSKIEEVKNVNLEKYNGGRDKSEISNDTVNKKQP